MALDWPRYAANAVAPCFKLKSIGIAGIYAFYSAREHLYAVREAARVTNEEPPADIIGQHTEDGLQAPIAQFEPHFILNSAAISVDTLGELYNSPNWDIKQASASRPFPS